MGSRVEISVIMATYNRGYVITRAIESVINQNFCDWELIIIDDGSSDNTQEIVKQYKDDRIILIQNGKNKGACYSRNVGMAHAHGDYYCFLDSDCSWSENYLYERITAARESNADLIFGRMEHVKDDVLTIWPYEEESELNSSKFVAQTLVFRNLIDTNTVMLKRICWEQEGGFDSEFMRLQDWEYFSRIVHTEKYKIHFQNNVLVKNYHQSDSISSNQTWGIWRIKVLKKHIEYCRKKSILADVIRTLYFSPEDFEGNDDYRAQLCSLLKSEEFIELVSYLEKMVSERNQIITELENKVEEGSEGIIIRDNMIIKDARLHQVFGNWIICEHQSRTIDKFLIEKNIQNVVIYGFGVLGRALFRCLQDSPLTVNCIIDKNKEKITDYPSCKIVSDVEACKERLCAEAVIVTALMDYEEIKQKISSNMYINNVFSLEEIICSLK